MNKVITSVDMNFSNNGGAHVATIVSVVGVKRPSGGDDLGVLNGELGTRYDFSNDKLERLMSNFMAVEETTSVDKNKKTITTKFEDKTSLRLNSHVVLVRGESAPIKNGTASFFGPVYYYSEAPNGPAQPVPNQTVLKVGSALVLGQTYNSQKGSLLGIPYKGVYRGGQLQAQYSYNQSLALQDSREYQNYNLLYGYKLNEFFQALSLAGVQRTLEADQGFAKANVLFNNSGKLSSVLSSIMSTLGYYWYVNPFNGQLHFVNSQIAKNLPISNPTLANSTGNENFVNAQYTETKKIPASINVYMGQLDDEKGNPNSIEIAARRRRTTFYPVDLVSDQSDIFDDKDLKNFAQSFYLLWQEGTLSEQNYDSFIWMGMFKGGEGQSEKWAKVYPPANNIKWGKAQKKPYDKILPSKVGSDPANFNSKKPFGSRKGAEYYRLTNKSNDSLEKPSSFSFFHNCKTLYDRFFNQIYISRGFSEWRANRIDFENKDLEILGPFEKDTKVSAIPELDFLVKFWQALTKQPWPNQIDIEALATVALRRAPQSTRSSGDYYFVGIANKQHRIDAQDNQELLKVFEEDIENSWAPPNIPYTYLGFKNGAEEKIDQIIVKSKALFKSTEKQAAKPIVNYYTVGNDKREEPEEESPSEASDQSSDLENNLDIKSVDVLPIFANGNILQDVSLKVEQGSIAEMEILKDYAYKQKATGPFSLKTSSKTIYGLEIPESKDYSITLSSLSIRLGADGITTTITESTKDLIPLGLETILASNGNTVTVNDIQKKLAAGQKNLLRI